MSRANYIFELIPELSPYEVFDYFDGPRFYSCRDKTGQLYVVYWVDQVDQESWWLYLKISSDRYAQLKNGALAIAQILSHPEEDVAYLVKTNYEAYSVEEIQASQIQADWLPEATDTLNFPTPTLPEKSKSAREYAASTLRQVLDLAFERTSNSYELGCGKLGKLLDATQNTLFALASDQSAEVRRVPDDVKYQSEFLVTGVFAGSFGIRLQSRTADLFSDDRIARTAETLATLLTDASLPEAITENLKHYNVLTRSRFKHLIRVLVDAEVSLNTDWGSPSGKSITSRTTYNELSRTLQALDRTDEATKQKTERPGRLVGVDVESDFFALMLEDREVIKGRLAKHLMNHHFEIPSRITANLEETCVIDPLTEKEKWTYVLVGIRELS